MKDGRAFAVGTFAQEHFRGKTNISLSKLKLAVPKILTALWAIKERLNLASEFSASIGFLLPAGECVEGDIKELEQMLLPELSSFTTPSGKMRVSLVKDLTVKPEGAGVLLYHQKKNTKKSGKNSSIGFLGIGYRNSNMLIWKNGGISAKDRHTSDLGFDYLLSEASSHIGSALTHSQLNEILILSGWNVEREKFDRYLKSIGESNRSESIASGIKKAKKMYMHYLEEWLSSIGVDRVETVVTFGGAAEFLKVPLTQYCESNSVTDICWHGEVKIPKKVLDKIVADQDEGGLDFRMIDPWCYLHILNGKIEGYEKHGYAKLLKENKNAE
ncbi:MAG: ParM/StbA family protein [Cyanobacteria bacterium J06623_7]